MAFPNPEALKLNKELTSLSEEIQKLNSTIGSLAGAMLSPSDSSTAPRVSTRKRARVDTEFPTSCQSCKRLPVGELQSMDQVITGLLDAQEGRLLTVLVDTFFTHIGRWIPMLQENAFRRRLLQRKPGEPLPLIVHAMIVGALRVVNAAERLFSDEEVEENIERAMIKTIFSSNSSLSVESLQALIVMSFVFVSIEGQTC